MSKSQDSKKDKKKKPEKTAKEKKQAKRDKKNNQFAVSTLSADVSGHSEDAWGRILKI